MSGLSFHLIAQAFQQRFNELHNKLNDPIISDHLKAHLYLLREDMEHLLQKIEETLILLDMDGTWELSEDDWKRLKQQHQTMELYKSILPIVLLSNNIKAISTEENYGSKEVTPSSKT